MNALPPGPRLPMLVQTYVFGRHRHRWLPALRRRYGDVFTVRIAPGGRRLVVVADTEVIRDVFAGPATTFHAGESNDTLEPLLGSHSVLLIDEDEHLAVRKQLMPAFNGAALRGYRDLVAAITKEHLAGWPTGVPVAMHPHLQRVTLDVIMRVVFGVTDPARLATLRPLVEGVVSVSPLIMLAGYYPRLRRYGPWRRHLEIQQRLDEELYAEIAERRAAARVDEGNDVFTRLLTTGHEWSDEELRDQLITLLLAGHETTATSLAWTMHELARSPDVQRAAHRAASANDDAYLSAVAKESLRVHPVIYEVGRLLTEPATVAGWDLPAGVSVMPAIGLVHADDAHHPGPERFRPERFLGDDPPSSHTWLPFGGGARRCLGAGFSLMESEVILREVMSRFEIRPATAEAEPPIARNVTLAPKRGARVVLTRDLHSQSP